MARTSLESAVVVDDAAPRPNYRRRLLILAVTVALVAAVIAGLLGYRSYRIRQHLAADRDLGYAALANGDYLTALRKVGPYLNNNPGDADALYAYARARQEVEAPRDHHLADAISFYRRLTTEHPGHTRAPEANARLLDLYERLGLWQDVLSATAKLRSETVPADNAAGVEAMRLRSAALARTGAHRQAIDLLQQYAELRPLDADAQLMLMGLEREAGLGEAIGERIALLQEQAPDDPRVLLVQAGDASLAGNAAVAREKARIAAQHVLENGLPEDGSAADSATALSTGTSRFINRLVLVLDAVGERDLGDMVLENLTERVRDPALRRQAVNRLFQAGRWDAVVSQTGDVDRSAGDGELLGLRALALVEQGETDEVEQIVAALAEREAESRGQAWSFIIRYWQPEQDAAFGPTPVTQGHNLRRRLQDSAAALKLYVHPAFLVVRGEALADAGEHDAAAAAFAEAASASRAAASWTRPLIQLAWVTADAGRGREASAALVMARRRAPASPMVVAVSALLIARQGDGDEAIQLLDQFAEEYPDAAATTNTVHSAALAVARAAAHRDPVLVLNQEEVPTRALFSLFEEADHWGPDVLEQIADRLSNSTDPATVALAAGLAAAAAGDVERAKAAVAEDGDAASIAARLIVLRWVDPDAARELALWILSNSQDSSAGAVRADDLRLRYLALASGLLDPSATGNWSALRRNAFMLVEAIDDVAAAWPTRVAVLDLNKPAGQSVDTAQLEGDILRLGTVTRRYPRLIEPRLTLVAVLDRLGNPDQALQQLYNAVEQVPENATLQLALAERLISSRRPRNEIESRLRSIERIIERDPMRVSAAQRLTLANLLERIGQDRRALAVLTDTDQVGSASNLQRLELLRRTGQLAQDDVLPLLESEDPASLQFAAEAFRAVDDDERSKQALDRLDALAADGRISPSLSMLAQGQHRLRSGDVAGAKELFEQAIDTDASLVGAWRLLTLTTLKSDGLREAAAVAESSLGHVKGIDADRFEAFQKAVIALDEAVGDPAAPGSDPQLIQEIPPLPRIAAEVFAASDAEAADAMAEAVVRIIDARRNQGSATDLAHELEAAANLASNSSALQELAIRIDLLAGRTSEAAARATALAQREVRDPEAARLAVDALVAGERYGEALQAAEEWRERLRKVTNDQPRVEALRPADLSLARLHLLTDQPGLALGSLRPYLGQPLDAQARALAAQAHLTMGSPTQALSALGAPDTVPSERSQMWSLWVAAARDAAIQNSPEGLAALRAVLPDDYSASQWPMALQLAEAYAAVVVSATTPDPEVESAARDLARHLTAELTAEDGVPAAAFERVGIVLGQLNDSAMAEQMYRQALAIEPDRIAAGNNLAMLLVTTSQEEMGNRWTRLDEAMGLIDALLDDLQPQNTGPYVVFLDTKAAIHAARAEFDAAETLLAEAMQRQPEEPEWPLHLAEVLLQAGNRAGAHEAWKQFDALASRSSVAFHLRDRAVTVAVQLEATW